MAGTCQTIDSAFIKAIASLDTMAEKEVITDAEDFLNELNENDKNKASVAKKANVFYHHSWKEKAIKKQPEKAKENKDLNEIDNISGPHYLRNTKR